MTLIAEPTPALSFRLFRLVALVEGVTTLLLFFAAMPVKYLLGDPLWVQIVGPIHGYAFLAYLVMMVVALRGLGWSVSDWTRTTLASFVPFGTFLNDPFLRRRYAQGAA
jgi:integral membrane protein